MVQNTCEIPLQFSWRVDNGSMPADEFNVVPSTGAILPGGHQQFLVEFIPRNVCKYKSRLVLDMPKVADEAMSIAVTAECVVPRLTLSHDVLDFGACFLQHPYTLGMTIANTAKLPVKFRIEPQDEISVALAEFTASPASGAVAAKGVALVGR
jgi:hydrocephalus-inducing protein